MNIQKIIAELVTEKKKLSKEIGETTDIRKRAMLFGLYFAITKELKSLKLKKLRNRLNSNEPEQQIKNDKSHGLIGNSILLYLADKNHAFLALGLYAFNASEIEILIALAFAEKIIVLNKKKNT